MNKSNTLLFVLFFFLLSQSAEAIIPIGSGNITKGEESYSPQKQDITTSGVVFVYISEDGIKFYSGTDLGEYTEINDKRYVFVSKYEITGVKIGEKWYFIGSKKIGPGPTKIEIPIPYVITDKTGKKEGDPVNTGNGNLFFSAQDLFISSKGHELRFARHYRSDFSYDGPLGYGWTDNINILLMENADDGKITCLTENGGVVTFTKTPDGSYSPSKGAYSTLIKERDESFILVEKDGTRYYFKRNSFVYRSPPTPHGEITYKSPMD